MVKKQSLHFSFIIILLAWSVSVSGIDYTNVPIDTNVMEKLNKTNTNDERIEVLLSVEVNVCMKIYPTNCNCKMFDVLSDIVNICISDTVRVLL